MQSLHLRVLVAWSSLLLSAPRPNAHATDRPRIDGAWEIQALAPVNLRAPGAAWDPARQRLVVVGGETDAGWTNEVLVLEFEPEVHWRRLEPRGEAPPARARNSMVHDAARDRMILFGGTETRGLKVVAYDDVWELDLAEPVTWRRLNGVGPVPEARFDHSAILDAARDRMLIFGGASNDSTRFFDDVWQFDLDGAMGWSRITTGPGPSARLGQAAILDAGRDRVVLCGGYDGAFRGDAWELDLDGAPSWRALPDSFAPRAWHRIALDVWGSRLLVHGGRMAFAETAIVEAYDLASSGPWTRILVEDGSDMARRDHVFAYDPSERRVIIAGGAVSGALNTRTFVLAGNRLDPLESIALPGRVAHTLTHDPVRRRMVLVDGLRLGGRDALWSLDLTLDPPIWSRVETTGPAPVPRHSHTMVYDPPRDRMLLFGGFDETTRFGDLWELTLTEPMAWNRLQPDGVQPPARYGHAAVFDHAADRMLVFAGNRGVWAAPPYDDIWEFAPDANTWTELPPLQGVPVVRNERATILDPVRNRMIVHGSPVRHPLSWSMMEFDLSQGPFYEWREIGDSRILGTFPYAVYDPVRDRILMLPELYAFPLGDSLIGRVQLQATGGGPASGSQIAYDAQGDRFIMHAGNGRESATWAFVPSASKAATAAATAAAPGRPSLPTAARAYPGAPRCEDMPSPELLRQALAGDIRHSHQPDGKLDLDALRRSGYAGPLSPSSFADSLWDDRFLFASARGGAVRAAVIVGGKLAVAIGKEVHVWDGTNWVVLPAVSGAINAMTVFEGQLVVGTEIPPDQFGQPFGRVARWDGSTWRGIGGFFYGAVRALAVYGSWLIAAGDFTREGSFSGPDIVVPRIGIWGGPEGDNRWYPLPAVGNPPGGSGGTNGPVHVLGVHGGQLIVGGAFTRAGGKVARYIAQWCCGVWSPFDGKGFNSYVTSLGAAPDGALVAGGTFTHSGRPGEPTAAHSIATWNGNQWNALGSGFRFADRRLTSVRAIGSHAGSLYAGGNFDRAGEVATSNLARWDGSQWTNDGRTGANATVTQLLEYDGRLHVAGEFDAIDGYGTGSVATWTGERWRSVPDGLGLSAAVHAFTTYEGELIAGGRFHLAGNGANLVYSVARWTGSEWRRFGNLCCETDALTVHAGRLFAGGNWPGTARMWQDDRWVAVGDPGWQSYFDRVRAFTTHRGELVAAGTFRTASGAATPGVARWDGSAWHALAGGEEPMPPVNALLTLADTVYAAAKDGVHAWDGGRWHRLGGVATHPALALIEHQGAVVAGGRFWRIGDQVLNGVGRWSAGSWRAMASFGAEVRAFTKYQGQLIAAGEPDSMSVHGRGMAAWENERWVPFGSGLWPSGWLRGGNAVHAFGGDLWVGGWFDRAGPYVASNVSRYRAPELALFISLTHSGPETNELVITLAANTPLADGAVELDVDGTPISLQPRDARIWSGRYPLAGAARVLELHACARSDAGMRVCSTRRYAVAPAAGSTSITSPDGSLSLQLPADALPTGTMVVVESDSVGIPIDPTATRPVRGWSIHPAIAIHGTAMLSLRYPESLDAPPDAIAVFGSGGMQFPTIVDPAERVIRARVDRLGDFLLRVSNPGTSTIARPHFLDFEPNVPNPFNPTTRIRFTIEATQQVRIDIHDVAGRRVARLLEARTIAGTHDLRWDGRGSSGKLAASGTYLCTIATEHASATRKLVLLR